MISEETCAVRLGLTRVVMTSMRREHLVEGDDWTLDGRRVMITDAGQGKLLQAVGIPRPAQNTGLPENDKMLEEPQQSTVEEPHQNGHDMLSAPLPASNFIRRNQNPFSFPNTAGEIESDDQRESGIGVEQASGLVASILSRIRPATALPRIEITMIAVTWAMILMSPSGVSCAIRVRLTAVGRREYTEGPPFLPVPALGPRPGRRWRRECRAARGRGTGR